MAAFEIPGNKNLFGMIFHEDLYLIEDQKSINKPTEEVKKPAEINTSGTIKELAIVVLSAEEKKLYTDFLSKIMQAINVSSDQADIYSREEAEKALNTSYKTYISFGEGLRKTGTGIALKINQVISEGQSRFLLTDTLSSLESDREKKKALWNAMQKGLLSN